MKQALIIVGHKLNTHIFELYDVLSNSFTEYGDVYLVLNVDSADVKFNLNQNIICLTSEEIFAMGYTPIKKTIIPGSNHFILLWFYKHFPNYDYYWNVEYDVAFSGNWRKLFVLCEDRSAHFLSTHIKHYNEDPYWYWWNALYGDISQIDIKDRLRSFNPIYRISKDSLSLIDSTLLTGNYGHHEVLVPTLLYSKNYSIEDFGGTGIFTPKSFINKIYIQDETGGTMRYRPIFNRDDKFFYKNRLYHPVK